MSIFGNKHQPNPVTCDDVVAAYGLTLERHPSGGVDLPYDAELIKAALIQQAREMDSPEAVGAAKAGFVALNAFIGRVRHLDLASTSEARLHKLLDVELDKLEEEFESRLALSRRLAGA